MRLLLVCSVLPALVVLGCRTPKERSDSDVSDAVSPGAKERVWQQAIRQAQEEDRSLQPMDLAAEQELTSKLGLTTGNHTPSNSTFASFRNEKFLLVFGKDSNITEDDKRSQRPEWSNLPFTPDDTTPLYEKPVQYRFNANPVVNCNQLITRNDFSRSINEDVFLRVPERERSRLLCAYIKFKPVKSRPANRTIGDLAEANLYLASDYRPYGLDVSVFTSKRDSKRVTTQTDPDYSVSSAIDAIPYDLPNLYALSRAVAQGSSDVKVSEVNAIGLPADPYVQRQLAKAGIKGDPCSGKKALQIIYKDRMGLGKQVVHWCKGHAWPTMIENQKSLSVLVPNEIK
jgi:hypothetical protein